MRYWMNPEIDILGQTQHDCCDHPEISTLRQTHCDVDHLHSASGLVIVSVIFRPSLSERIVTAAWRHQSHVTLLLKVAVSQYTHILHVVPEQLVVTSAGASQITCDSTLNPRNRAVTLFGVREAAPRSRNFKIREIEFFLGVCPRAGCDRNISAEYRCVTRNRTRYTSVYVQLFVVVVVLPFSPVF